MPGEQQIADVITYDLAIQFVWTVLIPVIIWMAKYLSDLKKKHYEDMEELANARRASANNLWKKIDEIREEVRANKAALDTHIAVSEAIHENGNGNGNGEN